MKIDLDILQDITNYILETEHESFEEHILEGNPPEGHIYAKAYLVWQDSQTLEKFVTEIIGNN